MQPTQKDELPMQNELERQINKFNTIIDTATDGILLLEAIRDKANNIIDFRITHCNKAGCHLGRLPFDAKEQTLLEVLPHLKDSEQLNLHKKVVETGVPVQFETTFRNEKGEEYGWFIVSLLKLEDGVLSRFVDITEKKENEEKIVKQADFLNSVLEASLNGIFVCEAIRGEDGTIADLMMIKINKGFVKMIGKTAEEVEGKTYLSLFPTAKNTGLFDKNCTVIETGKPIQEEVYYKGEGLDAWYDISLVKLGDNGLVVTFSDISRSKQALVEIEQQRNLLDNILKHSPSGISVTKVIRNKQGEVVDGITILANDASIKFTGIPKDVYLSKRASELDPNILNSPIFKAALSTLETGEPFLTQYFFEGQGKWLEIGVSKMDNDHLVNVFTDVTEIKESQLKLEKLVEDLKRSNAQLEEFTYAASHDLKEPIRKVSIFANRLKTLHGSNDSADAQYTLERLQTATERMQLLVDDLLEYSHVSNRPVEFEEIDLNEKMRRVLGDMELMIEEKGAKINVSTLPTIKGFRRQVQQLFQNLIANSLKYSKPGIAPIINITAALVTGHDIDYDLTVEQRNKQYHLIKVSDNGIGFEQQYADRIFNIFQRLHGKNEYTGSGVGLSIARKVAENHSGYITAESEPGKGSTFNVYLPV